MYKILTGFLHDAGRFDDLRQEHLSGTEEVSHHVHAVHERTLDHLERSVEKVARLLDVLVDKL